MPHNRDKSSAQTLQAGAVLQPSEKPETLTQVLRPCDGLYRHSPAVVLGKDGGRVYLLREGHQTQDSADLLAWEATSGEFTVPSGLDGAVFAMQKGGTPQ
jgi:hypothetical protein